MVYPVADVSGSSPVRFQHGDKRSFSALNNNTEGARQVELKYTTLSHMANTIGRDLS